MKKIFLVLFILITSSAFAKPFDNGENLVHTFQKTNSQGGSNTALLNSSTDSIKFNSIKVSLFC